jgi:probable HAF family extracellular repeat protein
MNTRLSSLGLLTAALLLAASQAQAQSYIFWNLDTLGGNNAGATAINNGREIVGWSEPHDYYGDSSWAALWDGYFGDPTYLMQAEIAHAINDANQAVGTRTYAGLYSSSVLWEGNLWEGNQSTEFGAVGLNVAAGINDRGQIVGYASPERNGTIPAATHAVLWNDTTTATVLPSLYSSQAYAINNHGVVAGWAETTAGGDRHAVVWDSNGITDLGSGAAYAINDAGQVAGVQQGMPTVWSGGIATHLAALGGVQGTAMDINEGGQVVGYSNTAEGTSFSTHATLWEGAVAIDLNRFLGAVALRDGWVLTEASGINDRGDIVGTAHSSILGVDHAFLLTPVPEPAAYFLMLSGLVMMGFIRRGQRFPVLMRT